MDGTAQPTPQTTATDDESHRSGRPAHPPGVGFLLSQLGFATSRRFHDALAPLGLDPGLFAILRAIAANGGESQQAVCVALHVAPSRMVAMVDELESRGLVERRVNASDRRARSVHLTDEGLRALDRGVAAAMQFEEWISTPLAPAERAALLDLLRRLAGHYGLFRDVHPGLTDPPFQGWPSDPPRPRSRGASRS